MKLIAIVGLTGSGKSEAARILEEEGYQKIRFGDITEEELRKVGMEINEANEKYMRERLRKEHGMAAYAIMSLPKIKSALEKGKVVIDGLYSWDEYLILKNTFSEELKILAIQASPKTRYERLANRPVRPLTHEEARKRDHSEIENIQKGGPIAIADLTVVNEGTPEELKTRLKEALGLLKRPSKDEYYMQIAREVSKRATCLSMKTGAIIVKDDQIIATGYNGAPRKTLDCAERGFCLRRKLGIPSGQRYELCRSVHSEMNCIINSARAGVSLLGGDLFIYGVKVFNDALKQINAFPCFICKKFIINAGIKRVVCSTEDGRIKTFEVSDWATEWKEKDLMDDAHTYDSKYWG